MARLVQGVDHYFQLGLHYHFGPFALSVDADETLIVADKSSLLILIDLHANADYAATARGFANFACSEQTCLREMTTCIAQERKKSMSMVVSTAFCPPHLPAGVPHSYQ